MSLNIYPVFGLSHTPRRRKSEFLYNAQFRETHLAPLFHSGPGSLSKLIRSSPQMEHSCHRLASRISMFGMFRCSAHQSVQ